jgi:hypothetical protein
MGESVARAAIRLAGLVAGQVPARVCASSRPDLRRLRRVRLRLSLASESQRCEAAQHRAKESAAPRTYFVAGLTADT